jgi:hypothetical protein
MTSTTKRAVLTILFLVLCRVAAAAEAGLSASPTVGIEGSVSLEIPGPQLFAIQRDKDALLYLWIVGVKKNENSFTYDFRYVGMRPGKHNLLYYLRYQDGASPAGLQHKVTVEVKSALEEGHVGYLTKIEPVPIRLFTWYREIVAGLVIVWAVLLVPLVLVGRPSKKEEISVLPPQSLADRLRPLVVKAADGKLTLEEKALFERLMLGYWCQRLELDPKDILKSLAVLRKHDVAGELICAIESWFHKPISADGVDIAALLEPYRNLNDEEESLA